MAGLNAGLHLAALIAFWNGSTPIKHILLSFSHQFRVDHIYYASAYFLLWDFFGAVCGSFMWILSDTRSVRSAALFLALSVILSPGSALMLFCAHREERLMKCSRSTVDATAKMTKLQ
ncbi:hypothetical protein BGZ54_010471 [Gamsiella multidivaricata]|nr:hypothetical protein BGZ54_010471 [Gamsiella multidivaricata]